MMCKKGSKFLQREKWASLSPPSHPLCIKIKYLGIFHFPQSRNMKFHLINERKIFYFTVLSRKGQGSLWWLQQGACEPRHAAHQGGQELAGNQPGFPRKCVCTLLEDSIQSICSCRIYMHVFQELAFSYGKKKKKKRFCWVKIGD